MTGLASSGMVDVLGHADVIKVHGFVPEGHCATCTSHWSRRPRRASMGVEISSQGLLRTIGEMYPAPDLLDMFHAAGVPVMFASDAHAPDEVGPRLRPRSSPRRAAPGTPTTSVSTSAKAPAARLPVR